MPTETDLSKAKKLLNGDITCVFLKDADVFSSTERGIAPLLSLVDGKRKLDGYSAADRIVGKAAAFLYVLLKVSAVYGEVMTAEAERILRSHGIHAEWGVLVERIINRRGDGPCPMEEAVQGISSPEEAPPVLRTKLASLRSKGTATA